MAIQGKNKVSLPDFATAGCLAFGGVLFLLAVLGVWAVMSHKMKLDNGQKNIPLWIYFILLFIFLVLTLAAGAMVRNL